MPKLRFLDAKQVDKCELLSVMQLQGTNAPNSHQSQTEIEQPEVRMEKFGTWRRFFGLASKEPVLNPSTSLDPRNAYNPLPNDEIEGTQASQKTVYYGKVRSHYEGSQSQGNRFILNKDL